MSDIIERLKSGDASWGLREKAANEIERLNAEGAIKDGALNASVTELNELARWVAFDLIDNDRNKEVLEWIGRLRDQCLNATHGKLSSDPFPVSDSPTGKEAAGYADTVTSRPTHWEKGPDEFHCIHCGMTWDMHLAGSDRCTTRRKT